MILNGVTSNPSGAGRWPRGVAIGLLLMSAFFVWEVMETSSLELGKREEARELSHASYGLLNPVVWIEEAGKYLEKRIDTWVLTEEQSREWAGIVRKETLEPLDRFFHEEVIEKGLPRLMEEFQGSRLLGGLLGNNLTGTIKSAVLNGYEDVIRPGLGSIVEEIVVEVTQGIGTWLNRPETKEWLKKGLREQVKVLKSESGLSEEESPAFSIQRAYGCETGLETEVRKACAMVILEQAEQDGTRARTASWMAGALLAIVIVWAMFFSMGQGVIPLFGALLLLWGAGISLPMLSVEARIGELELLVGGSSLRFEDNVLFYQSKSVLEFIGVLIAGGKVQTIVVGILVGLFSVLFPMAKLTGMAWLHGKGHSNTPSWVKGLVLHTGKWSMADVFVVALFMGYLGFGRMIQSQIDGIGAGSASVRAVATDGTQLEFGFFYFLAFCLVSIASTRLFKETRLENE